MPRSWQRALLVAAALVGAPLAAFAAEADGICGAPASATAIVAPLERVAARIDAGGPLNIVAVGSSSTSGIGASGPQATYPADLEAELRSRFPGLELHVLNRGIAGEDAPEELARLPADAVAPDPDLVIWQVGTNAVLRRDNLTADGERVREGIGLMRRRGIDVVLMDLQYAPRVLDRPTFAEMEELIADDAARAHVGLFRRFAMMRYWQRAHNGDAPAMVGPDGLHMTDTGYHCLAVELAAALEANWRADRKLAQRPHDYSDTLAGLSAPARPAQPNGLPPNGLMPARPRPADPTPLY